ncbi:MAG: UDP-N-acetylglucosamine 2-epimerase (non-hydrolyzing) [Flavobacteriales bacterium]|nr:UDP-N-acetylglucosamine 2-epimerase (non-hydrolyzing) [Flavobacteriales bacterium]
MKILTILGARPQFIKAAALSREFKKHHEITEIIVHTGQHFDKNMSDIFFEEMEIPKPNYFLDINSLNHGAMTGRMMEKIEYVIEIEKPDYVMVYGDTNSTLAGAITAKKKHIKLIHVEAGLRSFNMNMPEEINRILTDRISDYLFCPTPQAYKNLMAEGFANFQCKTEIVGDVMEDAILFYSEKAIQKSTILTDNNIDNYILCTIHRQENTDNIERLTQLVDAINKINSIIQVVIPLHPRTKSIISKNNLQLNAKIINPVGYLDMLNLTKNSKLVLTDSGGLQKEAFILKKFCITLRDETEWVELVENKVNFLVGSNSSAIIETTKKMLNTTFTCSLSLYGNGKASANIVAFLFQHQ